MLWPSTTSGSAGVLGLDQCPELRDVVHVLAVRPDEGALAVRSAVTAVVDGVHGVPGVGQCLRHVLVAARVLSQPVKQHHHRLGLGVRQPRSVEDRQPIGGRERALAVSHTCSLASSHRSASDQPKKIVDTRRPLRTAGTRLARCAGAWNRKPAIGGGEHRRVVVGVAGRDDPVVEGRGASTARRFWSGWRSR